MANLWLRVFCMVKSSTTLIFKLCWWFRSFKFWSYPSSIAWKNNILMFLGKSMCWRMLFSLNLRCQFWMGLCVSITILILRRIEHVFKSFSFRICSNVDIAALISSYAIRLFGEFHCSSNSLILWQTRHVWRIMIVMM